MPKLSIMLDAVEHFDSPHLQDLIHDLYIQFGTYCYSVGLEHLEMASHW